MSGQDPAGIDPGGPRSRACAECLARPWLLARLAGHLDLVRQRIAALLELGNEELIEAVGGKQREQVRSELGAFQAEPARERAAAAGLEQICRCDAHYPVNLTALASAPAVLHVAGGLQRFVALTSEQPVAVVGARRASPYGTGVARSLGRAMSAAGVTLVSGMASGIDSAAHQGAIDRGAGTLAVLPGTADRPYPASARALHRRIWSSGAVVSELPPGTGVRRWMFPARNRIIAALAAMTVVIEARADSGALLTAGFAAELGRPIGAVPGRITSPLASGPHQLLRAGAILVGGPQDVIDGLFGAGARAVLEPPKSALAPSLQALLDALADGYDTATAIDRAGFGADGGLAALASLELAGRVRRESGGRFSVLI